MNRLVLRFVLFAVLLALLTSNGAAQSINLSCQEGSHVKIVRSTPIMIVDHIEPSLDFWMKRLGFKKTAEVPHGDELGFILLEKDGNQVMMQTRKSIADDSPATLEHATQHTVVQYIDVDSLDAVLKCVEGMKLLMGPRETFYGAREILLRDPAGYMIMFAEQKKK
ncbi:MAG: VOC family protein [Acidobacteriia bacterium]|nr:VOC family protein [Terriglobia bacterium]